MELGLALAGTSVRAASTVSPRWGAAVAMPLFASVAKPRPVHRDDEYTMSRARRRTIRIAGVHRRGTDVTVYEWGSGERTVVLAHGWDGRASQFATLVRDLVAEGFRVVAFDAPAHGESAGRRTYLVDWIDVLTQLQAHHGRFAAVVGHSFGGLGSLVAVAGGVEAERVVTVASPADAELLLAQFQTMLGYSDGVARELTVRFVRRYFPTEQDPFAWLSAVRRPLSAGTPLLVVHDERDRVVPFGEAARIAGANPGSISLATTGLGHSRILKADAFLDAVLDFVTTDAAPHGAARADGNAVRRVVPPAPALV
ncbi:alpha/beta fold hydrolase [Microbacterium cremeum]|uniref:alpha/beta fold hydrolase n=1 Tax=Microbacterium cremeum TaxID=2782169 RepID=UPI001889B6AD|nr:alpha/beta fold hydrolase [Microbacterium cremeum]